MPPLIDSRHAITLLILMPYLRLRHYAADAAIDIS